MNAAARARCWPFLLALLVLMGTRGHPQDVSMSPIQWVYSLDPPDELPVLQSKIDLTFPDFLRDTPGFGYVFFEAVIDARGRLLDVRRHASHEPLEQAYQSAGQWKFTPARRDRKGVNSKVMFALLFNPASARPNQADSAPRLLEVEPVWLKAPEDATPGPAPRDIVVHVDLRISETGAVSEILNAPPAFADQIGIALKNWRFEPARENGQPVAAGIRAPVVLVTIWPQLHAGKRVEAKVISRARPFYPIEMHRSGMRGEVLVDFAVDIEGRVRNAHVVKSLNPAFDDPAIEAVRKWRFEPGRIGTIPVHSRMMVPIVFNIEGGGIDSTEMKRKPDFSKLPPELHYDTPPILTGSVRPVYPYEMLAAGTEGHAIAVLLIDEEGHIVDIAISEASDPAFGKALLAAVGRFTYQPALKNGQPGKALLGFRQDFKRGEEYQLVSYDDLAMLRREQKRPESIVTYGDIDGPLNRRSYRRPEFPKGLPAGTLEGEAVVECIIDEHGRPRLMRVVSAAEEAFGYAAVQEVAAWRLEPPKRGGRPAAVRVQTPVKFSRAERN